LRRVLRSINRLGDVNRSGTDAVIVDAVPTVAVSPPRGVVISLVNPLPEIGAAVEFNRPGVVLDGGGTVPTGLSFGSRSAGSLLAGVTLRNFRDNAIVLDASPGVTVRGCVIQANGNGIRAAGDQAGSTVVGNTFTGNRAFGIHLYAATGLTIDGNIVTGLNTLASMGLYATGTLTNTVVVNNTFRGGLRGALLQNARGLAFGRLGQGNTLSDNVAVRSQPRFAGTGIRAEGDMTGTTVTANTFARNNYGFGFVGARGLRLVGNIFERNSLAGIHVDGDNTGSSQAINTFGTGVNANKANIVRAKGSRGI
jgi:parallel beta-helix repeat protein